MLGRQLGAEGPREPPERHHLSGWPVRPVLAGSLEWSSVAVTFGSTGTCLASGS